MMTVEFVRQVLSRLSVRNAGFHSTAARSWFDIHTRPAAICVRDNGDYITGFIEMSELEAAVKEVTQKMEVDCARNASAS
jgi:hypothetical protein